MPGNFPSTEEQTISRLEYQAMVKDLYSLPVCVNNPVPMTTRSGTRNQV